MPPSDSAPLFRRQTMAFATVWVTYCVTYFLRKPLGIVKTEVRCVKSMSLLWE